MRPSLPLTPVDCLVIWQPSQDWPGCPLWYRLVKWCLKPGFGHVLVLFYDPPGDAWCVINPVYGAIQAQAISAPPLTLQWLLAEYPGTTWASVRRDRYACPRIIRGPLTCVSVVKAVLGIGGWSWTPYQLYRQLHRQALHEQAQVAQAERAEQA